jgi:DNA-binding transcriptional LysR family regulator
VGQSLIDRARRLLADADEALDDVRRQVQPAQAAACAWAPATGAIAHLLPQALQALAAAARRHRRAGGGADVGRDAVAPGRRHAGRGPGGAAAAAGGRPAACGPGAATRCVPSCRPPGRCPRLVTPAWLAARPLILNDATTRLSRLTVDWFARAGLQPRARIELNYNDAIKSLVAAGYGAALLPHEAGAAEADARIVRRPLRPALWRPLALAWRDGGDDGATRQVLAVLDGLRQAGR